MLKLIQQPENMLKGLKKNKIRERRVFVMMSGGVDSSVAALLLKKQGYDVIGVFIHSYNIDGCQERDAEDARRVAEKLNIPFYVWDFEEEYKKKVVDYMVEGYRKGITPNPDVMCNKEIKFGLFLEKALEMGADYVATGHYARLASRRIPIGTGRSLAPAASAALGLSARRLSALLRDQARRASETFRTEHAKKLAKVYSLFIAKDKNKDQSYFLWTLMQKQLKHCLFPIGDYLKSDVRKIARKADLSTAEKKDSQGICFLGKVTLDEFLKQYIPEKRGEVLSVSGEKLGEHKGAHFYTIGQRHINAEIRNLKSEIRKDRQPFYVAEKDVKTNTLILAEGNDNNLLFKKEIRLSSLNWIPVKFSTSAQKVFVRVRYRQPLIKAKLFSAKGRYKLIFSEPVKFVASGQSAVFYDKDGEMLGGGIIL